MSIQRETSKMADNLHIIRGTIQPDERKIVRVAAYCRVSTQLEIQTCSLETQIESLQRQILQHPDWELAGIYADRGSGRYIKHRQEFTRLVADVEAGKVDYVITKSLSRFARNTLDTLNLVRRFKELGVGVYFEEENMDSMSEASEILLTIRAAFAQEESRSLSENFKAGIRNRYALGQARWATTYGYHKDKYDKWVINEEEAKIVRRIFDLYVRQGNAQKIADMLNKEGVPGPKPPRSEHRESALWWNSSVIMILRNERYIGDMELQKTYVTDFLAGGKTVKNMGLLPKYYLENTHEPIVSREIFKAAHMIMAMTSAKTGSNQYPYYGFLKCPYCGTNMTQASFMRVQKYYAWFCSGYPSEETVRMNRTECPPAIVSDAVIDRTVVKAFEQLQKMETDEQTKRLIAEHRELPDGISYKFLYDLVESITFPLTAEGKADWKTMVVRWKCGVETRTEIEYTSVSEEPAETVELCNGKFIVNGKSIGRRYNTGCHLLYLIDTVQNLVITDNDDLIPYVRNFHKRQEEEEI